MLKTKVTTKQIPVIISHGYQVPNTGYSAIAKALAQQNYYVISIQHELPTDAPIPATGSLDNRRMPFPRTGHPRIYSLRSNDQPADDGVLPTPNNSSNTRCV